MGVKKVCETCVFNLFNELSRRWVCTHMFGEHYLESTNAEQTCELWKVAGPLTLEVVKDDD